MKTNHLVHIDFSSRRYAISIVFLPGTSCILYHACHAHHAYHPSPSPPSSPWPSPRPSPSPSPLHHHAIAITIAAPYDALIFCMHGIHTMQAHHASHAFVRCVHTIHTTHAQHAYYACTASIAIIASPTPPVDAASQAELFGYAPLVFPSSPFAGCPGPPSMSQLGWRPNGPMLGLFGIHTTGYPRTLGLFGTVGESRRLLGQCKTVYRYATGCKMMPPRRRAPVLAVYRWPSTTCLPMTGARGSWIVIPRLSLQ